MKKAKKEKKQPKLIRQLQTSGIEIEQLTYNRLTLRTNLSKCLWDALVIFFFVFGLIGFFTTTFSLPCNMFKLTIFAAFISTYFSLFYLRKYCFNIGYIITLFSIIYYSIRHYEEVNSGYSAILNLIIVKIDEELNLSSLREFNEAIEDRYVTITACMIVIITLLACLFNMWVSRRNSILYPLFVVLLVMEFCIYLNDEFSYFYLLVILMAFTLFIFTKQNDELAVDIKKRQRTYITKRKRILLKGRNVELKGNLIGAAVFTLTTLFVSLIAFTFVPETYVEANSEWKDKTDEIVSIVAMRGFSALFGSEKSGTGGMNNGTFGDVKSVSLDYETDLEVTFVPYTSRPVYIPTFYANTYDMVNRRWYQTTNDYDSFPQAGPVTIDNNVYEYLPTYVLLNQLDPQSFSDAKNASASFMIKNVAAGNTFPASLYYDGKSSNSMAVNISRNEAVIMNYTPLLYNYHNLPSFSDSLYYMSGTNLESYVEDHYLSVPIRLQNELQQICNEQNFHGTTSEVCDQIIDFLRDSYQYTLNPGATPEGEDFVLYFLQNKKQGFCVHFASSACLLLRQMGIPAKYVEGYCFDYSVYEDATLFSKDTMDSSTKTFLLDSYYNLNEITDFDLDDLNWYDGYNPWDFNDPVTVDLTDANAHAWVEVYFEGFGWVPVEFTVGSMAEDDDMAGFSSMLNGISAGSSGGSGILDGTGINQAAQTVGRVINYGLRNMVMIVFIIIVAILLFRKAQLAYMVYYSKEDRRAIYQYRFLTGLIRKDLSRRYKERRPYFEKMIVSHSVLKYLLKKEYGMSRISAERAVYRYEEYNYSESGCGVNIDNLTDSFLNISDHIIERFGFVRRFIYRLYLYMPRKDKNKNKQISVEDTLPLNLISEKDESELNIELGNIEAEEAFISEIKEDADEINNAEKTKALSHRKKPLIIMLLIVMAIVITIGLVIFISKKGNIFNNTDTAENNSSDYTSDYEKKSRDKDFVQISLSKFDNAMESNIALTTDISYYLAYSTSTVIYATYIGESLTPNTYLCRLNNLIKDDNGINSLDYEFTLYINSGMSDAFPELKIGDSIIIPVNVYSDSYCVWSDYSLFHVTSDNTIFSRFAEHNNYDGWAVDKFIQLIKRYPYD